MVADNHKAMLVRTGYHHASPNHGRRREIERRERDAPLEILNRSTSVFVFETASVEDFEVQLIEWRELLQRLPLADDESCAQAFVSAHDLVQASRKSLYVELAADQPGVTLVEGGALRRELLQEPDSLLPIGEPHGFATRRESRNVASPLAEAREHLRLFWATAH